MSNPSPTLAAFLSFVFPGLGQAYAGDTRKGIVWAIPMLLAIVLGLLLLMGGSAALTTFLTADKALALIIFDLAFFFYHVAAMVDAYDVARRGRQASGTATRTAPVALALLISLAIVLHGLPAMVGLIPYYNFAIGQGGHTAVIPQASFAHVTAAPVTPGSSIADPSLPG